MTELTNLALHFLLGITYAFFYYYLIFRKRSFFKDCFFSFLYIMTYFILLEKVFIITHFYLIISMLSGFALFLLNRKYFKKHIENTYFFLNKLTNGFKIVITPPLLIIINQKRKHHKELKAYYKRYPYLKKNIKELF